MKQFLCSCVIVLALFTPVFAVAQAASSTSSTETTGFTVPVVKSWFSKQYEKMEVFRKKQEVYFVTMRDELKVTLKIDQKAPDTTVDIGIAGTDEEVPKAYSNLDDPLDYGKYIFAIAMATAFSNPLLFYVATLLLAFIVLKFIVRMVV